MSLKVEYHKPEFTVELVSRRKASSLVFPLDPSRLKPESRTLLVGEKSVCGRTKTGLLPLTDRSAVPLHGGAVQSEGTRPDAPMPMIFSALRSVICFTR